jgi:penicillin amidase
VVNPPGGQLVTANNRQLAGPDAQVIGDGGFDLGARAGQLGGELRRLGDKADVPAVFRAALDDRALYMAGWRERAWRPSTTAPWPAIPRAPRSGAC